MKKWFFVLAFLFAGSAEAADLVYTHGGQPESSYNISQSSVAISSVTTSIDSSTVAYRAIYVFNSSATTFYYRIDGSTQSVALVGYPVLPGTAEKIETNSLVGYQVIPGAVGSIDIRKKIIRK
jgi:hypothetical protein